MIVRDFAALTSGALFGVPPFFGTEKVLYDPSLDPALRSRIAYRYGRSGRLMYLDPASRRAQHDDGESFIRSATRK